MNGLLEKVAENVTYVLEFAGIIAAMFVVAFCVEKFAQRKQEKKTPFFTTRKVVIVGMFSAVSGLLMLWEIPLPFAPSFYKLDFSELPVLIGTFAYGPATGVLMEFLKILIKLVIKGTSTAFVGDLANFVVGSSMILPAGIIYYFKKTKKTAVVSCVAGTLMMAIVGSAFNAIYLLPAFSAMYGMPLDAILKMGKDINPLMTDMSVVSFVIACVVPFNLIKGAIDSVITLLVYKPLSPIIKANHNN